MSILALYQGPRAILFRCVWIPAVVSGAILAVLPIADRLTPNDFSIGLLLRSIMFFAFGLGVLASLLFLALLFFRDVRGSIKLRAFAAVILPYIVIVMIWLVATRSPHPLR